MIIIIKTIQRAQSKLSNLHFHPIRVNNNHVLRD